MSNNNIPTVVIITIHSIISIAKTTKNKLIENIFELYC